MIPYKNMRTTFATVSGAKKSTMSTVCSEEIVKIWSLISRKVSNDDRLITIEMCDDARTNYQKTAWGGQFVSK